MADCAQFAYRTQKSIAVIDAAPHYVPLSGFQKPEGSVQCCTYSACGRYFAWSTSEKVTIIDAPAGHIIGHLVALNVFEISFSPQGTFVITWQRPWKDENGAAGKNLKVWAVTRSEDCPDDSDLLLAQFPQKSQTGRNLQFTKDEKYCAFIVTNELHIYQIEDLRQPCDKLRIEGLTDFAISPGDAHSVAIFIPERKGQPATVKIFNLSNLKSAVSQKNFFKGDKVQLKWNNEGTSLLVLAQTEVDKSGKSYDGETTLYLLSAKGGFDSRVDLDKEGPIHDVTWSPNSKEFGVVYGYMPAKTVVFNTRAVVTHQFALSPRNTILFSPHGRFVLVAGFGVLIGQMDIYDVERDYRRLCTIEATNASVCQWSPDEKYILTAITSPRLRVDNGIRIWHLGGGLMYNEDLQELYHVLWRPGTSRSGLAEDPLHSVPSPHPSALTYLGSIKTPSKSAGAYRPPGARGKSTPLAFKREDEGGLAYVHNGGLSSANGFGKARKVLVPGAEVALDTRERLSGGNKEEAEESLSKAALKNRKKRETRKVKEAADKLTGSALGPEAILPETSSNASADLQRGDLKAQEGNEVTGNISDPHRSRQGRTRRSTSVPRPLLPASSKPSINSQIAAETPDLQSSSSGVGGSPQEKRIRALLKKLRAIDDLKMRLAGGEKLEGTQIRKMDTENSVRRDLNALGWQD